jgi:hypothetical protein
MLFFLFHNFDDLAYGQGLVTIIGIHKWFFFFLVFPAMARAVKKFGAFIIIWFSWGSGELGGWNGTAGLTVD